MTTVFKSMDPREQQDIDWGQSGNKQFFFIASEDSTVGSSLKMQQEVGRAQKQHMASLLSWLIFIGLEGNLLMFQIKHFYQLN